MHNLGVNDKFIIYTSLSNSVTNHVPGQMNMYLSLNGGF
jgi:hypothetical protein